MPVNPKLLKLNQTYTRNGLAEIFGEPAVATSREGIFTSKEWALFFVTLDKSAANPGQEYNDYFEDNIFYWESQNRHTKSSPLIVSLVGGAITPLLFVRKQQKVNGVTQRFVYAGRLVYLDHDRNSANPVKFAFAPIEIDALPENPLRDLMNWKPPLQHGSGISPKLKESAQNNSENKRRRGQGYESDPFVRTAIERWAMSQVRQDYEKNGYKVEDVSATRPYDFICVKQGEKTRRIEVKGTRGTGEIVFLTANEVKSANEPEALTDLAICFGIVIEGNGPAVSARSGLLRIIRDWQPELAALAPTEYRYTVPTEV